MELRIRSRPTSLIFEANGIEGKCKSMHGLRERLCSIHVAQLPGVSVAGVRRASHRRTVLLCLHYSTSMRFARLSPVKQCYYGVVFPETVNVVKLLAVAQQHVYPTSLCIAESSFAEGPKYTKCRSQDASMYVLSSDTSSQLHLSLCHTSVNRLSFSCRIR